MKAILYKDVNSYDCFDDIVEPNLTEELNVKIKVLYCGICGSDIHKLLHEKPNMGYVKTNILGHEMIGKVVDIGTINRKDIEVGNIVSIEPILYCDNCYMCTNGYIQFCKNVKSLGRDIQGGFAEYIAVNEKQLYKIEDETTDTVVKRIALADPYSVAMHIKNIVDSENKRIGIIGDGIIGLATAELLSEKNDITVFGKHKNREEILNKINVVYYSIEDYSKFDNLFDVTIEAVGGRQNFTLITAIEITKPKGKIIVSGVFDNKFEFNIPLRQSFYKELNIVGCNSFEKSNGISDFKLAVDFLKNKTIIADDLISKTFKIDDFNLAIKYIQNRRENNCIKVLIEM